MKVPPILFKIIWPILYFLLLLSILFLYQFPRKKKETIQIILFWVSLFLNFFWIFLYFYLKNEILSFIDLCLMIFVLIILLFYSYPGKTLSIQKKFIFYVFLVYFFWLCFAFYLSIIKLKMK